jgi:hypothetical protein
LEDPSSVVGKEIEKVGDESWCDERSNIGELT